MLHFTIKLKGLAETKDTIISIALDAGFGNIRTFIPIRNWFHPPGTCPHWHRLWVNQFKVYIPPACPPTCIPRTGRRDAGRLEWVIPISGRYNKVFHKITGKTPTQYRQERKN